MSLLNFSWLGSSSTETALPEIYPVPVSQTSFVEIDVTNIFTRILTDVLERTQGIPEKILPLLSDNCLGNESQDGLVTLLSKAMYSKSDLFLVYDPSIMIVRKANSSEASQIKEDYKTNGESSVGTFITFKNFTKSDMIKFYSALEYCSVGGLYKSANLSKAIQIKLNELRSSVGASDSADAKAQALKMAQALAKGQDIMLDGKDVIETAKPDLTATNSALELIAKKQSFYLGLPTSWVTGELQSGLGDSGKGDSKAVERGLKPYYYAIIKPVCLTLFKAKTTFKSDDFEMLSTANDTLKVFEVTSEEYLSSENKQLIVNKLYGLPEDAEGDGPPPEPVADPTKVAVPPKE